MKSFLQVYRILPAVLDAVSYFEQEYQNGNAAEHGPLIKEINEAVDSICKSMKDSKVTLNRPIKLREDLFLDAGDTEKRSAELEATKQWVVDVDQMLSRMMELNIPSTENYEIDILYKDTFKTITKMGKEELYKTLKKQFFQLTPAYQRAFEEYFEKYPFWGSLDAKKNDFTALENRAEALYEHRQDFLWMYDRLSDYRSRYALLGFVFNWFSLDFDLIKRTKEQLYFDYFDLDIIKCDSNEVFVDLGAFSGDTVQAYVKTYGNKYKRIYCYEITPDIFKTLKKNCADVPRITLRQKGVSDEKGTLYIDVNPEASGNRLLEEGKQAVETVTIDEDIDEPVTFIKMDIEGFEQKALMGCKNHIVNDKPKLAISVYHNNEDIWKIARMIEEICPGYRFYLRYHGGNLTPSEMSLLAIYPDE